MTILLYSSTPSLTEQVTSSAMTRFVSVLHDFDGQTSANSSLLQQALIRLQTMLHEYKMWQWNVEVTLKPTQIVPKVSLRAKTTL